MSHRGLAVFHPQTLTEAVELAGHLAKSSLVPNDYRGKPENVLVAMQLGAEVGLSPFQALQSIAVINGRPGMYGDAGLALVQSSGLLEDMDESDDPATQTATCWMKRKNGRRVERTFSQTDAERVTMYERDNNNNLRQTKLSDRAMWKSFPKRMRQMRARWWTMRDLFPDVLKGLVGREEHDVDATPIPPPTGEVIEGEFEHLMPKERATDAPAQEPAPAPAPMAPVPSEESAPLPAKPEPAPAPAAAPTPPPDDQKDPKVVFDLNGRNYQTAGITKEQLMETFKLAPRVDKANKDKDPAMSKKILRDEFKLATRPDLTEEAADRYIIRLKECLGEV